MKTYYLAVFLNLICFVSSPVYSQSFITTSDTTICRGTTIQLSTLPALAHTWSPTSEIDDPNSPAPFVTPSESTTYYVDAFLTGPNIIANGDFSSGNSSFSSNYNYTNRNLFEGEYFVGNRPTDWNPALSICGDHTTGNGNMLMINGSPVNDLEVWTQVITVTPNTNYAFSTWIQALWDPNPAKVQFSINGVVLGSIITAELPTCTWSQFYTTWNSGSETSVTISIVNKNTEIYGNDFALDDISFTVIETVRDSVLVTVDNPVITTINDTSICSGSEVQLIASGGEHYQWTPSTGLNSSNIANPISTPPSETQYFVTGYSALGCSAKDSVLVSIHPASSVVISNDTLVCKNTPVQLYASGGVTYSWTPLTGLDDPNASDPVANIDKPTTYTVTLTDNYSCSYTDSLEIGIIPNATFGAAATDQVCPGIPVSLSAFGGDNYQWEPSELFDDPTRPASIVNIVSDTEFYVHISENTCNSDTTIILDVDVKPIPTLQVSKSNDITCNTPDAQLQVSGAVEYKWSPASGLSDPESASPRVSIDSSTSYTVTGVNEFGCSTKQSMTVHVSKEGNAKLVLPNAFTPNADNKNDCFGIRGWGNSIIEQFSIFNRWGQIVFQSQNPLDCWDGTFKGKPQDSGGYTYIVKSTTLCGLVVKRGIVMLIR